MFKVLFITRKWPPAVGGMETYSVELTSELKKLVQLSLRTLPGRTDGSPPGLFSLALFFLTSFQCCFTRQKVNVIHLGDLVIWPLSIATLFFNRDADIFISAHGTDIAYPLRRGLGPRIYSFYLSTGVYFTRNFVTIIANSNATAAHCAARGFKHIHTVPLGVKKDTSTARINTHIKAKNRYVLFVGRLAKRKGVGWFIKNVLPNLPDDIILKVAGTKWDDEEWVAVNSTPRVQFLGAVYGEQLADLRYNSLVTIMPNRTLDGTDFEGFGLTALEAATDGGILLASGIDGIVDAVINGVTGWLLTSENPEQWESKILEIYSWDSEKRNQFITKAKNTVQDKFSWERVAMKTVDIYRGRGC